VEDGKDRGSGSSGERRTWMLDPDNALCGLLRCGRREVCLLQDRFTAVCVNKQEVTKNGDKIIPLKEATTSKANEELPKSWDALDDYDDDDDYEDDDDYLLDDEDEEDESEEDERDDLMQDQTLNRGPFADKQCPSCPVVRPTFLCGSDNRTYSSLCRLHYHNCIHDAVVRIACKGFCPCTDPNSRAAKKERQRDRMDAYMNKMRETKDESETQAPDTQTTSNQDDKDMQNNAENTTTGRVKKNKHNKDSNDKYNSHVRSRYSKVKNYKNKYSKNKYNKHEKDSYRKMDKYNKRTWGHRNENSRKNSNTVWGPNECSQEALEAMGNRMLDWFSVIMADARTRANGGSGVNKGTVRYHHAAPTWCKAEVAWMLGHLDNDEDSRLSVKELYQLEHDDHERCIKPFIDRCDLDRDIFLSAREWCKCFDKSERPCAALRRASKGLLRGYIPECDSEGYYQATQCHASAGVCWCVDRHGVELPNTRTRGTPNCDAVLKNAELSNHVDDEDDEDDDDTIEGSADMPLDI